MRRTRVGVKLAAVAGAAVVAMTAFAPAAAAAAGDTSTAEARFLSGSGGGTDFDTVAALEGATVKRTGDEPSVKEANALEGSVLGQSLPKQPDGINVPLEQVIQLGAVNQYAKASPRAKAVAASGAVANGGVINTTNDKDFPADATLDLAKVPGLPPEVTKQLLDLKLNIGAISSVAAMDAKKDSDLATTCSDPSDPEQCRDYRIAGANITLKLQALKTLSDKLKPIEDTLNGKQTQVLKSACEGIPEEAGTEVERACDEIEKAGAGTIEVSATPPGVQAILDAATRSATQDGVTVDLTEGTVVIDLAELLRSVGLDLNNLPPNTELVQYIAEGLATNLPDALNKSLSGLAKAINKEMGEAAVKMSVAGQSLPKLSGKQVTDNLSPLIDQLSAEAKKVTEQVQTAFAPGLDQLGALTQLITIHANVQDSPADGVFRETALKIELLKGALPGVGMAAGNSALEINLARAQVGGSLGEAPPDKAVPVNDTPDKAGPNLPNTGASTLDLPFLLLGFGLLTAGMWIIMYGRAERPDF